MTKPWKQKKNSSNILLVLITLILIKAKCSKGEIQNEWKKENFDEINNSIEKENEVEIYVGNDDIAQFYFHSSSQNNSLIVENIKECLDSFQLLTCLKMLLLDRINDAMKFLEDQSTAKADLHFLRGLLVFKRKNKSEDLILSKESENLSLDKEITAKVLKIFQIWSLQINFLPRIKMEIQPVAGEEVQDLVCFKYKFYTGEKRFLGNEGEVIEGRKKRKGGGISMMMVPQLLMLGLMPFTLASLKAMVMNAVMINMMALNGAIFMTIRNLVFGPRRGDNVKYVNYGYSKDRQTQSPKPVLIIHSPAAFVQQPKVHQKPIRRPPPSSEIFIWDPETKKGHFVKKSGHRVGHSEDGYHSIKNSGHNFSYNRHINSYDFSEDPGNYLELPRGSKNFSQSTGHHVNHPAGSSEVFKESEVEFNSNKDYEYKRRRHIVQERNSDGVVKTH